jgi:hypothetical protein
MKSEEGGGGPAYVDPPGGAAGPGRRRAADARRTVRDEINMKTSLLLALALMPIPAQSECIAFLIPPTVRVTSDEKGLVVWRPERTEYVTAFAAGKLLSHSDPIVEIEFGNFSPTYAACTARDFRISKKTGLLRLWTKKDKSFEAVWAKQDGLIVFGFPPDEIEEKRPAQAAANLAAAERAAALARDRVKSTAFEPPGIENQRVFAADLDTTWAALVETLSDQRWQIEIIDKGSGLITTKPAVEEGDSMMVCAAKLDEAHKTSLNVFVQKAEAGTRVKVNSTFQAVREDKAITCFSNGTLEKALFDGMQKILGRR